APAGPAAGRERDLRGDYAGRGAGRELPPPHGQSTSPRPIRARLRGRNGGRVQALPARAGHAVGLRPRGLPGDRRGRTGVALRLLQGRLDDSAVIELEESALKGVKGAA